MTRTFFADTSFIVDLIRKKETVRFIITDYIFDETLTTILNRGGKQLAIEVATKIYTSPTISIATINREIFSKAYELFVGYADQEWSFTDCCSITFLKEYLHSPAIHVA